MSPITLTRTTPVFNLSLGSVLTEAICLRWTFSGLEKFAPDLLFEIFNDVRGRDAETELEAFHTIAKKQTLGYNPYAYAATAKLRIHYPDHPKEFNYQFVEKTAFFAHYFLAMALSFLQRRRVLFGPIRLIPSEYIITFPPLLAGEMIDAPAFGRILVGYEDLQPVLDRMIITYTNGSDDDRLQLETLPQRFNNVLNLPYAYERAEALWRIVEALGKKLIDNPAIASELDRVLTLIGAKRSENLKRVVLCLMHYGISYADDEIVNAFLNRNASMHEYLNRKMFSSNETFGAFHFLQRCVEQIIFSIFGLKGTKHLTFSSSIIEGRVL